MSTGAPIPPNPAYPNYPPPQPPPSSSNTVLKIVLIVVGVIVIFGVVVAGVIGYGVYKVSHAMHKNANGDVSIALPTGTISTGASANLSAADLGVPPYPGASSVNQGSMNMKTPTGSMVTSVFTSTDSADKIIAFYKDKLGDKASIIQTGNGTMLSSGQNDKDKVMVTVTPQDGVSKIVILHMTQLKQD
jgi:energy-converting hydrogenase Eha subunit A